MDPRCCCTCFGSPSCAHAMLCTVGQMCIGVAVYMSCGIMCAECVQCCCYPRHGRTVADACKESCFCKFFSRENTNDANQEETEPPKIHVMIRNPDGSLNLGTVPTPGN